jgi:hypothetical protein
MEESKNHKAFYIYDERMLKHEDFGEEVKEGTFKCPEVP